MKPGSCRSIYQESGDSSHTFPSTRVMNTYVSANGLPCRATYPPLGFWFLLHFPPFDPPSYLKNSLFASGTRFRFVSSLPLLFEQFPTQPPNLHRLHLPFIPCITASSTQPRPISREPRQSRSGCLLISPAPQSLHISALCFPPEIGLSLRSRQP